MSVACSNLGLDSGDFCLPLQLTIDNDEFMIHEAWIAGAFFLGIFIGAALTALCVRPFLISWAKKKKQDDEEMLLNGPAAATDPVADEKNLQVIKEVVVVPLEVNSQKRKKSSRFKRWKKVRDEKEGIPVSLEIDEALCRGMIKVISQSNSMTAEMEMAEQDVLAIVAMARSLEQERDTLLLKCLEFLLRKKAAKHMVTDSFCGSFLKKTEQDLRNMQHILAREKAEDEKKGDQKLSKMAQSLESELQLLQARFTSRQGKLWREYLKKIRADLTKSSGMSEEEVEGLMEKIIVHLAILEEKIGQQQVRRRRALEERLAKRRQVIEYKEEMEKECEEMRFKRISNMWELLNQKVMNGQLLEQQRDELVDQYQQNLSNLYNDLNKGHLAQWQDLASQLRQARQVRMQELMGRQFKEKAVYALKAEMNTSLAEIVKGYHELLSRQLAEQEEVDAQLDAQDVKKLEELNKEMKRCEEKGVQEEVETIAESLQSISDITHREANSFLEQCRQHMDNLKVQQQRERQAMLQRLHENLQQRLTRASEAEARDAQEQQMLLEDQTQTIQKMLAASMHLTEAAKAIILNHHQQNQQALFNHLQLSKMGLQKSLELQLYQHQANTVELKNKKEELMRRKKQLKEQDREKLEAELLQQMEVEKKQLEEARQMMVMELRRHLAAETAKALHTQDEDIGLLIAHLQMVEARRKAILERPDKSLKELQNLFEQTLTVIPGQGASAVMVHQLMQQYHNHLEHFIENLQRARKAQEKQITEKIAHMRKQQEREIETRLESEAEEDFSNKQQRGAGYASLALIQFFLEQRLQRAMAELEQRMVAESEKEKDKIRTQAEQEMQKELQSQRQRLLTQLAAVGNLSHQVPEDTAVAGLALKGRSTSHADGDVESPEAFVNRTSRSSQRFTRKKKSAFIRKKKSAFAEDIQENVGDDF